MKTSLLKTYRKKGIDYARLKFLNNLTIEQVQHPGDPNKIIKVYSKFGYKFHFKVRRKLVCNNGWKPKMQNDTSKRIYSFGMNIESLPIEFKVKL